MAMSPEGKPLRNNWVVATDEPRPTRLVGLQTNIHSGLILPSESEFGTRDSNSWYDDSRLPSQETGGLRMPLALPQSRSHNLG